MFLKLYFVMWMLSSYVIYQSRSKPRNSPPHSIAPSPIPDEPLNSTPQDSDGGDMGAPADNVANKDILSTLHRLSITYTCFVLISLMGMTDDGTQPSL